MRCSGRLAESRARSWAAAALAQASGDVEGVALAALALGGIWVHEHRSSLDQARVESLQRAALVAVDPSSVVARRLRVRLAAEQAYLDGDATPVLAELDAARAAGEPVVIAEALSLAHHCLLGPHDSDARLRLAEELIQVSPRTGRPIDALMGLAWRTIDLLLAGDRRAARSLSELRCRLQRDRWVALEYLVAAIDVMVAVRQGRLDDAETLAGAAYEVGRDVGDADALGWYGAQLIAIRWLQGRADELLPLVREIADSTTLAEPDAGFVAAVAAVAAAAADRPTAAAALACVRAGGLRTIALSSSWLATLGGVCEAAHLLGDVAAAAEAYTLLAPFADRPVMASIGVASFGSAHRPLGLAARTMGELDHAVEHLEQAVLAELAAGDRPWHAMALATLADVLDERAADGDRRRAAGLWAEAAAAAQEVGMERRAQEWRRHAPRRDARCHRDGACWSVELAGRRVTVPHSVGLDYLAQLVANPGVEIDAIALVSGHTMTRQGASQPPVVDRRAVESYRRRIAELRDEIDESDAAADDGRAARARAELDELVGHLARSSGLHGAGRPFADDAERARVSVHKALKRALLAIANADPALGAELAAGITTGLRCAYRPT